MPNVKTYRIAVMSTDDFDNLVAEVMFEGLDFGLILSQERSLEEIDISVFSFAEDGERKFLNTEKIASLTLPVETFLEAIEEAKRRLRRLDLKE